MSIGPGRVWRAVYLFGAMASAFAATHAQTPAAAPSRTRILGVFSSQTGEPVEGAQVLDVATGTSALTTKTGTVSLSFLADSGSMVRVQKIGFRPAVLVVTISPADTLPVTVILDPVATKLPTVVTRDSTPRYTSPGLRDFEERRKTGVGRFISEAELRKNDSRAMTNLIRGLGVKVECTTRTPIRCFATSTRSYNKCDTDVYRDGVRVSPEERDLEKIRVDEIGGVEAYFGPASIPTLYNQTGSSCGVLLFWTRER